MRRAQQSNVFLVQTTDPRRLYEALKLHFPHKQIQSVYVYRPYISLLSKIAVEGDMLVEENKEIDLIKGPYLQLTEILQRETTILIIEGVIVQAHADSVRDWLIAWSHDAKMTEKQSTVLVFTASFSFFAEPIRRRVVEIEPPISLPHEREELIRRDREEICKASKVKGIDTPLSSDEYFNSILPSLVLSSSGLTLHETSTATKLSFLKHRDFKVETFSQMRMKILSSMGLTLEEPRRPLTSLGRKQPPRRLPPHKPSEDAGGLLLLEAVWASKALEDTATLNSGLSRGLRSPYLTLPGMRGTVFLRRRV